MIHEFLILFSLILHVFENFHTKKKKRHLKKIFPGPFTLDKEIALLAGCSKERKKRRKSGWLPIPHRSSPCGTRASQALRARPSPECEHAGQWRCCCVWQLLRRDPTVSRQTAPSCSSERKSWVQSEMREMCPHAALVLDRDSAFSCHFLLLPIETEPRLRTPLSAEGVLQSEHLYP